MGEIEIIQIPCENYEEKEARLIEALLKIARALNIGEESGKSELQESGAE